MTTKTIATGTFVIRLWREANGGEWRGQITHIQSSDIGYFTNFEQVKTFLRKYAPGLDAKGFAANQAAK